MQRASRPVILLAFADPRGDLINLKAESNGIRELFWRFDDLIEIVVLDHPSFDQIIRTFQRYRNRIVAFHYGGHATGFELLLETTAGGEHGIGAAGLAEFLGSRRGLEFVFLNGCSTRDQVDGFLDAGVKCVIATTQAINDEEATEFAKHFYNALATDSDLRVAFHEASAATQAGRGGSTRALTAKRKRDKPAADSIPWQQHCRDETTLDWTFQWEARRRQRNIRGSDAKETASLRKLQALLEKVQEDWIDTVLRHSTHDGALIDLTLESAPEKVVDRWGHVDRGNASTSREVDYAFPGDRIMDVFDDAEQSLLIVGPPGSGKTTTLLQLAEGLLDRARSETDQSVPVFLHLSSWDGGPECFEHWVIRELSLRYFVSEKLAERWLENSQLTLLLDGMDEVPDHLRPRFVETMHRFMAESNVPGIAVCCDDGQYDASGLKLRLSGAVLIQPLTRQQIETRLASLRANCHRIGSHLEKRESIDSLSRSPLMLNILCEALDTKEFGTKEIDTDEKGVQLATNDVDSEKQSRSHVFDFYIERMLGRCPDADSGFSRQQTVKWLRHLAGHAGEEGSAIIQVERLQPGELTGAGPLASYNLAVGTFFGLGTAFVVALFFWNFAPASDDIRHCVQQGLTYWLLACYPIWFCLLAVVDRRIRVRSDSSEDLNLLAKQGALKATIFFALWFAGAAVPALVLTDFKMFALITMSGAIPSMAFGAYGCNRQIVHSISSVEALEYDRRSLLRGALFGFGAAICVWLILCCVWDRPNLHFAWQTRITESTAYGFLIFFIALSLIGVQIGAIIGGLVPGVVKGKTRVNQGMRLSISNCLKAGLTCGVIVLVSVSTFLVMIHERSFATEWPIALSSGMVTAYAIGLWYGGFELLKHAVLRVLMAYNGTLPLGLGSFLAHCARLKFLQRAGGGYLFVHPLLREHFVTMDD